MIIPFLKTEPKSTVISRGSYTGCPALLPALWHLGVMPGQKETSERTWSDTVILLRRKLRLGEVSTADRLMKPLREQVITSWGPRIPPILWGLSSHYGLNCEFMLYMMSPLYSDNPLRTTSPFLLVLADPVPLTEPVLGKYKWMNESIRQWADQCISEWMNEWMQWLCTYEQENCP